MTHGMQIYKQVLREVSDRLWACQGCGAVVLDTSIEQHDRWHQVTRSIV